MIGRKRNREVIARFLRIAGRSFPVIVLWAERRRWVTHFQRSKKDDMRANEADRKEGALEIRWR